MWICIVPRREPMSKVLRYGMCSQRISVLPAHLHSSANGINHTNILNSMWAYSQKTIQHHPITACDTLHRCSTRTHFYNQQWDCPLYGWQTKSASWPSCFS